MVDTMLNIPVVEINRTGEVIIFSWAVQGSIDLRDVPFVSACTLLKICLALRKAALQTTVVR